jgi:phosphohistidine swiveling domain-containing protein
VTDPQTDDPLSYDTSPGVCWTRTNVAEVSLGVLTPLAWSFLGKLVDVSSRRGFCQLGAIPGSALRYPDSVDEHIMGAFHGRIALNVSVLRAMMSGFPGVSGDDVERDIVGSVRPGVVDASYGWRGPAVVAKAGITLARSGKLAATVLAETSAWWSARFGPGGIVDGTPPRQALRETVAHFGDAIVAQSRNRMLFQGSSSQVVALAEAAGHPELAATLLSSLGGLEEAAVADDLHALADGGMGLEEFVARHGYHGPDTGNLTTHSWREDPGPLERIAKALGDSGRRGSRHDEQARRRAVETVLAALPAVRRPAAKLALRMAPAAARSLERSKVAFVMSLDGARASARALGAEMVAAGQLDEPDDAFFLFAEELIDGELIDAELIDGAADALAADARAVVARRKSNFARHQRVELTRTTWEGNPDTRELTAPESSGSGEVTGIGASPGVVEGLVKVVLDAGANTDVEPDEILVCPTTDPSWVPLMLLAGALVIDIGSTASHGAIIARELGVPCVTGTSTGTTELRTGDRVHVDGGAGVVTVLERAAR